MTPEADIAYATRTLQNMLDAGEIGTMTVDNQDRVRKMLATLRAAGAAVADRRADRPRRAKKWDGFRVAITGSENNYQLWRVEHISMSQLAPKYPLPEFVRAANEALANMIGWASR